MKKCSVRFEQVLPQTSYFAKSKIQAVPLAFPPCKINKPRRQLLFAPSRGGPGGGGCDTPGRSHEDFPTVALAADLFFHELISVC